MILTKKPMQPQALERLAKARAAMQGMSPRARGAEKAKVALDWIYRWGWASPNMLDLVTDGKRTGLAARLVRLKLVTSTKTESGGGVKGIPIFMLTLTQLGIEEVERWREDFFEYDIEPYRIDQTKLRHDQIAQTATMSALKNKTIYDFKTPREVAAKSAKEVKQADAIWIQNDGKRIGIEVELSAKHSRKLDQFVWSCIKSLQKTPNNPKPNEVDAVALVSDSPAILKNYSDAFKVGETLQLWEKNERGFWSHGSTIKVPEWIKGKFVCQLIG
jgi:hypothetical protein